MGHLAWQYLVFIFIACCGVLQASGAYGSLKGLLFFSGRLPSFLLGLALVAGAFVWFFTGEERAPPSGWPIIEGGPQAILFATGALLAFGFTVLLSSVLPGRGSGKSNSRDDGLEALRKASYLNTLLRRRHRG